ncbi:MAG: N-acetylornithine carbamoyltransferase [Bacteroidota bacterium]|nr:N-acetylornithine carbamoyltransferase [Bacteroidota bacterium]
MKHFISVDDVENFSSLVKLAQEIKIDPYKFKDLGKNKTLGLIFLNPSLRTRLSTQKAALNLGMEVMSMNFDKDGWALETEEGIIMDGNKAEHIKEGAAVIGQYCDIMGVRSFPGLSNREQDYQDVIINSFKKYAGIPVVNLESAVLHPLQSLTDLMTIEELKKVEKPKVVLSWAPHVKALPQAVPNSFAQWMIKANVDFVITHPKGYELAPQYAGNAKIDYSQEAAFEGADFIYAKNWSSYAEYGKILSKDSSWTISQEKMMLTNDAKFMHCLPVRRNLVVEDAVIDSDNSVVIQQAGNRLYAAQAVLKVLLEGMK